MKNHLMIYYMFNSLLHGIKYYESIIKPGLSLFGLIRSSIYGNFIPFLKNKENTGKFVSKFSDNF